MSDTKDKREFCAGPDASHYAYMSKATQPDMTLRDYFAAKAMQGLLSDKNREGSPIEYAQDAYDFADAMLKAREQ